MIAALIAAAMSTSAPGRAARAGVAAGCPPRALRRQRRRHGHLPFWHLPRARRQERVVQRRSPDGVPPFGRVDPRNTDPVVPEEAACPAPCTARHGLQPVGPFAGSASFLTTSKTVMSAGRSQGMSTAHGADASSGEAADDDRNAGRRPRKLRVPARACSQAARR